MSDHNGCADRKRRRTQQRRNAAKPAAPSRNTLFPCDFNRMYCAPGAVASSTTDDRQSHVSTQTTLRCRIATIDMHQCNENQKQRQIGGTMLTGPLRSSLFRKFPRTFCLEL